ncbi:hypothetical protein BDQ12DRAFT_728174 [Crucibulum laeve]|uniref:Uncharacterized protein n=1 Tax=Crucibulum laeve TaxID=68775 RepID=A0A5C3LL09_9AGAR|nr:hypothetical protein BDQ12DRAFT_670625 [Crucibulum laeve]TFK32973.1 hypothetical protein BDQ12DRAFT_728174 [Crucibulum laeve]
MRLIDSLIILAVASSTAFASNCTPGLNYCGSTLLYIGDYSDQISQHLHDISGQPGSPFIGVNDNPYDNILFECIGGSAGIIKFKEECDSSGKTCNNGGGGKNDFCA